MVIKMHLFYAYVFYSAFYSCLGWACETGYCSFLVKKYVDRGFLIGPFCPIYAIGALTMTSVLDLLPKNIILVFFCGLILTSVLEYITGFVLEVIFRTKWWDYSDLKFNIRGRVCLENSVMFGVLSLIFIYFLQPFVEDAAGRISDTSLKLFAFIFLLYFTVDLLISVYSVLRLNKRLQIISTITSALKEKLDSYSDNFTSSIKDQLDRFFESRKDDRESALYKSVETLKNRVRSIEFDNRFIEIRLIKAFPDMMSKRYPEYLSNIKEHLNLLRRKK